MELVAVDGLRLKDAAAALGIRPGTARVRMYRARRAARSVLASPEHPPQPPPVVRAMSTGTREVRS